jgi:hypothetical protein
LTEVVDWLKVAVVGLRVAENPAGEASVRPTVRVECRKGEVRGCGGGNDWSVKQYG